MKQLILLTTIAVIFYGSVYAEMPDKALLKELPGKAWEKTIEDEEYSYEKSASAVNRNNSLIVSGTYSKYFDKTKMDLQGIFVWLLNPEGKKIAERLIEKAELGSDINSVTAVASAKNEGVVIAYSFYNNSNLLITDMNIGAFQKVPLGEGIWVNKIIPVDEGYLLIGHKGDNSLFMIMDNAGKIIINKSFDRGKFDYFVDGIRTESGGFILIENTGKPAPFVLIEPEIRVSEYDSTGNERLIMSFPGRHGSIARGMKGGYAIAYDESTTQEQKFRMKIFDDNFKEVNKYELVDTRFGMSKVYTVGERNGSYLVAANIDLRPWIARIDKKGREWTYYNKDIKPYTYIQMLSSGGVIYLVTDQVGYTESRGIGKKVNALRLSP